MDLRGRSLADLLPERLSRFGLKLKDLRWMDGSDRGYDATATLSRQGNAQDYVLVFTAAMTLTQISRLRRPHLRAPVLVVGERITERSATALRDLEIQYIDGSGNAYIEFGDVYIDVRGRKPGSRGLVHPSTHPARSAHEETGTRLAHNLFSPRRSQVVFALLAWPHLAEMKIRDIAGASGVSVGQAHDTLGLLEEAGFLHRGTPPSPRAVHELLRPWSLEYPRGLRQKLTVARYTSDDPTVFRPMDPDQEFFLSGESATGVDIQRPSTLTVYVEHFDRKLAFMNRWRSDPDHAPNVTVMHKFWKTPTADSSSTDGCGREDSHNAPWPLVYADLLATNDPRLAEVAETWREHCA
ncbi:type IV toxin-antitoxin system AbiEi family antitoxin [Rhodococcus sp. NPDC060090]|uniref:type IV toxin-antitoxin system AbiEi family antitoxin n=1 Tax=Rhodococcus sp. NPDC060090 TaxID=3347056 RepID=UPI00365A554D